MSFQVPEFEPGSVTAGDLIQWKKTLPDFQPGAGVSLTYHFRGPKAFNVTATADGSSFSVEISVAVSATLLPGVYFWQAKITDGSDVHTVGRGQTTVLKNLSAVTDDNFDGRSPVKKALDAIEAVLTSTATRQQREYEIDGVRIEDKPLNELITLRDHYAALYKQELSSMEISNGRPGRKKILTRFVR